MRFGTFHAKYGHDQPPGVCWDQCCTTCGPIFPLGQKHHNVPTISLATHHHFHSFPTCLQFSQDEQAHTPSQIKLRAQFFVVYFARVKSKYINISIKTVYFFYPNLASGECRTKREQLKKNF